MPNKPSAKVMAKWFLEHYQDPVHGVPYNGREGGYQYVNGGPYDASEQIQKHFPNAEVTDVEKAVEEIESDGITEWVKAREY